MKTAFIIYCKAVGMYALITLPVLIVPYMYIISLVGISMHVWPCTCMQVMETFKSLINDDRFM